MKLLIYCAGGEGREIADPADRINEKSDKWETIEFVNDIRTEKEFDEASIPSAENIPAEELIKKDIVSGLPNDIPIIIYSTNDREAKKGLVILKEAGFKVFLLAGGYTYWKEYPGKSENMSYEELLVFKKELSAANFLKGIVSSDVTGTELKPVKKKKSKIKKRKKKNKLEGC